MFKNDRETLLLIVAFALLVFIIMFNIIKAIGEEEYTDAYIFCQPGSAVSVRENPRKTSFAGGELTIGDVVHLDGKKRNGYYHCVNMANETGDGWVSCKYIVFDEPVYINREATVISKGRLAARNTINGKVKRWLKPQSTLTVYYMTEEWCVTDKGYVKTKYMELD